MPKLFYLSEALKFAVEKEKESQDTYRLIAQNTITLPAKELFLKLVEEEKEHEKYYQSLLDNTEQNKTPTVDVESEEYSNYLKEMIAQNFSSSYPTDNFVEFDITKALNFAVEREKDSILFYVGLANFLPASERDKIKSIIQEEASHLSRVVKLRDNI